MFWSWPWFFGSSPTYKDFEIGLSTPQLHQIFKPTRLLTRTIFQPNTVFQKAKLRHTRFLAILKHLFKPSSTILLITTSWPACFAVLCLALLGCLLDYFALLSFACSVCLVYFASSACLPHLLSRSLALLGSAWLGLAWSLLCFALLSYAWLGLV